MKPLPWLKLHTEARKDMKLSALSDSDFRLWFRLLCYAAEEEPRGVFDIKPLTAVECGVPFDTLTAAMPLFTDLKLIETEGEMGFFPAFADRQYERPSENPEAWRERQRKHRDKEVSR